MIGPTDYCGSEIAARYETAAERAIVLRRIRLVGPLTFLFMEIARAQGRAALSPSMGFLTRLSRRLRYGLPIVVVSGLPRSGTSMAMKMLQAGGLPLLTDDARPADDSNPDGYFEFELVKQLDKSGDLAWLRNARGKGVKVISWLVTWLPESYDYRVIFMQRDLEEVVASQNAMLLQRGEPRG